MPQQIIKCNDFQSDLQRVLAQFDYDKLFILTDKHTNEFCLPLLFNIEQIKQAKYIVIDAGDINKNIDTLSDVWKYFCENSATRKSLLINLGGGMLTDLGGFAAATFKRGMRFINIPTTLLSLVDAAVGGKTGVNFNGLKNEIGVFAPAEVILIETEFLKSLDKVNFLSGYAEMIKHALLNSKEEWEKVAFFDLESIDYNVLKDLLITSIGVKEKIVLEDPHEKGIRKALNLGHTVGHAFESLSLRLNKPILHGYAVAWGLVCELYLSFRLLKFNQEKLLDIVRLVKENYGVFYFDCRSYEELYNLMKHDKKNTSEHINFTLLEDIGKVCIDQNASQHEIYEAFDFYRECFGC